MACPARVLAEPNAPALCDPEGLGGEIRSWPPYNAQEGSEFQRKAKEFEQKWKRTILETARARHLSSPGLQPALDAQAAFFRNAFGQAGDIVRACATKKFLEEKLSRFAEARGQTESAASAEQCGALQKTQQAYAETAQRLALLVGELREKFDPTMVRAGNKGLRLREFAQGKNINKNKLTENQQALQATYNLLEGEFFQLWGKGALASRDRGAGLDSFGFFSRSVQEAVRELEKASALEAAFSQEAQSLGPASQRCGSLHAITPQSQPNGRDQRATGGLNNLDGSSVTGNAAGAGALSPLTGQPLPPEPNDSAGFLERNWPWLVGGAAVIGGGAYFYKRRVDRQQDDRKAQADWDKYMAQQSRTTDSSTNATATVTTTTTATSTSTDTGVFVTQNFSGKEMEPLEIAFTSAHPEKLQLVGLPQGAVWDPSTQILRWIPSIGQAGSFALRLESGSSVQPLVIQVGEQPAAELAEKGPPDHFRDGDVGYVFIHGAGGEQDRCTNSSELATYWGASPVVVAPDSAHRKVACYNGKQAVATQAPRVAQQILAASCGRFQKCILVTHSMGGLLVEHMFTHARAAESGDPEPAMFANADLYRKVRERTLMVISLASAAGGSKVANLLQNPRDYNTMQKIAGSISRAVGDNNDAYKNLRSEYASNVVAPLTADPGVPIFLVAGYSIKNLRETKGVVDFVNVNLGDPDPKVFHGDTSLALLDYLTEFGARSDGLVDFRSACGIADASENGGPGNRASIDQNLQYCAKARKKPNHYVWFVINLNHFDLSLPAYHCILTDNPCATQFPQASSSTGFALDPLYAQRNAMEVIRDRLTRNRGHVQPLQQQLVLGF